MSKHMGFDCPKRGHRAMKGIPEVPYMLNGFYYVGRVCNACKCSYFEQVSDKKFEESGIVDATGKSMLIEEETPSVQ